jgi:dihydropteroate synthase
MGVLNVTPDSFSDGGQFLDTKSAVFHALRMAEQGADIIDIGGESTRPGSDPVSINDELARVIPVIESIRGESTIPISIDTYKSIVARAAIAAGANIINDISGLNFDPEMVNIVRDHRVPIIIMHIKGTPKNMQVDPQYDDLIQEVIDYFQKQIDFCRNNGVPKSKIILDPGIGFGKRLNDNFLLIRELKRFTELGYPVLIGPSRKSFIGLTLDLPVEQHFEGTAAAITAGIMNGARIIRVHDVLEMKRVQIISDQIRGAIA